MHHLNAEIGDSDSDTGAALRAADDKLHGYVTLSIDADKIRVKYTSVDGNGNKHANVDSAEYPAALVELAEGETVSL